ncbi:hypothetical protein B0H19DRAFT_1252993 [Mycena capillaripes]|nr:hypothetical protein B0H19DRAFT_1252993 [Mycena capillaripes]
MRSPAPWDRFECLSRPVAAIPWFGIMVTLPLQSVVSMGLQKLYISPGSVAHTFPQRSAPVHLCRGSPSICIQETFFVGSDILLEYLVDTGPSVKQFGAGNVLHYVWTSSASWAGTPFFVSWSFVSRNGWSNFRFRSGSGTCGGFAVKPVDLDAAISASHLPLIRARTMIHFFPMA